MQKARLIDGPIKRQLIKMTLPMMVGIFSLILFQLVDTYFISKLGTLPLAAVSFTFPITFIVINIGIGIGIGTTTLVSNAIGQKNDQNCQRYTSDSITLSILFITLISGIGVLSMDPLFHLMGATPDIMPYIKEYMGVWYLGSGLLVIPIISNSAIRATGDTLRPSLILLIAGLVNLVLDPLLIFGIGPFPRLEMAGAAIATVISWGVTLVLSLTLLTTPIFA